MAELVDNAAKYVGSSFGCKGQGGGGVFLYSAVREVRKVAR